MDVKYSRGSRSRLCFFWVKINVISIHISNVVMTEKPQYSMRKRRVFSLIVKEKSGPQPPNPNVVKSF